MTEILPFHDLCKQFDEMTGKEFDELVGDIQRRGLRVPIVTHKGKIIDGRNRARACEKAKVTPRYDDFAGSDEDVPRFILSMNVFRRHLKPEQRRAVLKQMLQTTPEKSNRAIAAETDISEPTVRRARKATASGDAVEKRTGKDGKTRRMPAKKASETADSEAADHRIVQNVLEVQEATTAIAKKIAEKIETPAARELLTSHGANEIQRLKKQVIGLENQIEDLQDEIEKLKKPRTIAELVDALVELLKREPGAQLGLKLKEITTRLQRVGEGQPDTPALAVAADDYLTKH